MEDSLEERRDWFDEYTRRCDEDGVKRLPKGNARYTCPCCGYPTLPSRGGYDICLVCGWEDDGQDDPHADEVWGGPNKSLSLTEARSNFADHLTMYDHGRDTRIGGEDTPAITATKHELLGAYEALRSATEPAQFDSLWNRVIDKERHLRRLMRERLDSA